MQFTMKRALTGGQAADPDPVATPGAVPDVALMEIPLTQRNTDAPPQRLLFTLTGTALQTAVVEVWALDDTDDLSRLASLSELLTNAQKAAREFSNATTTPITVTVDELAELTVLMPGPGKIYVRVTTATVADSILKVTAVA